MTEVQQSMGVVNKLWIMVDTEFEVLDNQLSCNLGVGRSIWRALGFIRGIAAPRSHLAELACFWILFDCLDPRVD